MNTFSHDAQVTCSTCGTQVNETNILNSTKEEENVAPTNLELQTQASVTEHTNVKGTVEAYEQLLENGTTKIRKKTYNGNKFNENFDMNLKTQNIDFTFKMSHLPKRPPINLHFNDITYNVPIGWRKESKTILKGVSGRFLSGELSAILGSSGSGKSTLMNVLSGFRTRRLSGDILVNGKPRCVESFRRQSCYIMQDDHLLQYLTIQESMQAAVFLKLGNNVSKSEKITLIKEILEMLKLEESYNTRVSRLSGGEKKRLSIALELANNPPVMFLDEPTSGLDSHNSYYCISLLRKLAEGGRNIICTIHQPSARLFEMFDYAYTLADGQCIYRGWIPGLVPFLASLNLQCPAYHNPSDFLIEIASKDSGIFIDQMVIAINSESYSYQESKQQQQQSELGEESLLKLAECEKTPLILDERVQYTTSSWIQFCVLLKRTFIATIRDPMLTLIQCVAYIVVGVFIGILYYDGGNNANNVQSNVGCLFISLSFIVYISTMMTVLTFPLEINVYTREHFNNWYSLNAYYWARTTLDILFMVIFTVLFTSIVYYMTSQPSEIWRFIIFVTLNILTSFVAQSIGLIISAAVDAQKAVYLGTAVCIPIFLLTGFYATFSTIPIFLRYLTYLTFLRYSYLGIMQVSYGYDRANLNCATDLCVFEDPKKILEHFEIDEDALYIDYVVLCITFIILRPLGCLIFQWKLRSER